MLLIGFLFDLVILIIGSQIAFLFQKVQKFLNPLIENWTIQVKMGNSHIIFKILSRLLSWIDFSGQRILSFCVIKIHFLMVSLILKFKTSSVSGEDCRPGPLPIQEVREGFSWFTRGTDRWNPVWLKYEFLLCEAVKLRFSKLRA